MNPHKITQSINSFRDVSTKLSYIPQEKLPQLAKEISDTNKQIVLSTNVGLAGAITKSKNYLAQLFTNATPQLSLNNHVHNQSQNLSKYVLCLGALRDYNREKVIEKQTNIDTLLDRYKQIQKSIPVQKNTVYTLANKLPKRSLFDDMPQKRQLEQASHDYGILMKRGSGVKETLIRTIALEKLFQSSYFVADEMYEAGIIYRDFFDNTIKSYVELGQSSEILLHIKAELHNLNELTTGIEQNVAALVQNSSTQEYQLRRNPESLAIANETRGTIMDYISRIESQ